MFLLIFACCSFFGPLDTSFPFPILGCFEPNHPNYVGEKVTETTADQKALDVMSSSPYIINIPCLSIHCSIGVVSIHSKAILATPGKGCLTCLPLPACKELLQNVQSPLFRKNCGLHTASSYICIYTHACVHVRVHASVHTMCMYLYVCI